MTENQYNKLRMKRIYLPALYGESFFVLGVITVICSMTTECDQRIQTYLKFDHSKNQEIEFYKHLACCVYCKKQLAKYGYDKEDVVALISLCAGVKKEGFEDRLKRAEERFGRDLKKAERAKSEVTQPEIESKKERFSLDILTTFLKPSLALVFLLLLITYPIYKTISNKPETIETLRAKGGSTSFMRIELSVRKPDGSVVYDNDVVGVGETVVFDYENLYKCSTLVVHYLEGEITHIQNLKVMDAGQFKIEDTGWVFETPGEHYFVAMASLNPAQIAENLETLRLNGPDSLKGLDRISINIRKVLVSP